MKTEDILCLVDNATTHTILKYRKKIHTLTKKRGSVTTIANDNVLIVGSGRASLILPMGTELLSMMCYYIHNPHVPFSVLRTFD